MTSACLRLNFGGRVYPLRRHVDRHFLRFALAPPCLGVMLDWSVNENQSANESSQLVSRCVQTSETQGK